MNNGARNGWLQWAGVAAAIVIAAVAGTAFVLNAVNSASTAALAAIAAQAATSSRAENDLDHRVTALEAQRVGDVQITDRLASQVSQLRSIEGDLTTAVQRLNDLVGGQVQIEKRPHR